MANLNSLSSLERDTYVQAKAHFERGEIDPDRLRRYQKLKREDYYATETVAEAHIRQRKFGKMVKSAIKKKGR